MMTADHDGGCDWTFLYEPDGINKFLDDLFSFNLVIMRNGDHDPVVLKMMDPLQIAYVIDDYFDGGDKTEMVVANGKPDSLCPFFKFIMKANPKHVPFRGGPDATNAGVGGHIPMVISSLSGFAPQVASGRPRR